MSAEEKARALAAAVVIAAAIAMLAIAAADAYRRGRRDVDRILAFVPPAPVVRCGECLDVLDADNPRAPSCLAHDVCLACAPTPNCAECTRELDRAGLLEQPMTFANDEQAWGWSS